MHKLLKLLRVLAYEYASGLTTAKFVLDLIIVGCAAWAAHLLLFTKIPAVAVAPAFFLGVAAYLRSEQMVETLIAWCCWPEADFWLLYKKDPEVEYARGIITGLALIGATLQVAVVGCFAYDKWSFFMAAGVALLVVSILRGALHEFGLQEDEVRPNRH